MYFKQIEEIVDGTKRQTRRVAKVNEYASYTPDGSINAVFMAAANNRERLKWYAGRDYAVSPGRGKHGLWWHPKTGATKPPGETLGLYRVDSVGGVADGWQPLRIRILEIRREPLQLISVEDAIAEGYPHPKAEHDDYPPRFWYQKLWETINTRKGIRWDDNPDVWVLRFEVVR